jgi:hypothetical protein
VQQRGGDGGIDAAGQAADHLGLADLVAHGGDGLLDEVPHRPGARALADLVEEVLEELLAAGRVSDFGVELHAVERAGLVPGGGVGAGGRGRQRDKIRRQLVDLVAVAHPHRRLLRETAHEWVVGDDAKARAAELARLCRFYLPTEDLCADLHAVADPEDRHAQVEDFRIAARRARLVDAARPAGQDQTFRIELLQFFKGDVGAHELAEHALLAHAAGDELPILRPEIEDRDDFVVNHRG